MNFIETIFGVSPDGGSGATELLFVIAAIAVVAALAKWRGLFGRLG